MWDFIPPLSDDELQAYADEAWAAEAGLLEPGWPDELDDLEGLWLVSHDLGEPAKPVSSVVRATQSDAPTHPAGGPACGCSALSPLSTADGNRANRERAGSAQGREAGGPRRDPQALLDALSATVVQRRRATAEEYRLIALIVEGAALDPDPWVGPDPTLDLAVEDPRRRSVAAVRRDRIDMAERAAVAEIAVQLRLSEQTVRTRASHARTLQERCGLAWRSFVEGRTSESHAVQIARLAGTLPRDVDTWRAFDTVAAERAERLTPAKFAVAARALRERVHAESIQTRHERAKRDRGVWMTAELDGMATLTALLPADRAHAALTRLDRIARHLHAVPDEDRTLAQLRADAMADLLSRGELDREDAQPASVSSTRPTVLVTVPALTLLGETDDPAILDGYGPIDPYTARRLAGEASSWTRILTHPVTGVPLTLDRTRYRVTAGLRRWLGVTSPTCVFPGCARPARECDVDHLTAWAEGGTTDDDNLEPECRHHHRLRHDSLWQPTHDSDTGTLRWRSPLGHERGVDPPPF